MKKVNKNMRTKLTALALAAVTAFSVGATAVTPAAALKRICRMNLKISSR